MDKPAFRVEDGHAHIDEELAVSAWTTLTQKQVDMFATATKDPDWMHVDVERSQAESPYGTTIVQGFLMMSLVIHLTHETSTEPQGVAYGLNYGMDRVRFTSVVTVGSRVRTRIKLLTATPRGNGRYLYKTRHTLEVDGEKKPAMVADWLVLYFTEFEHT